MALYGFTYDADTKQITTNDKQKVKKPENTIEGSKNTGVHVITNLAF